MIERIFYCQHFAGEEPYDAERKEQIAAASAKYRCLDLSQDEKRILETYRSQPLVRTNIAKAKSGEW